MTATVENGRAEQGAILARLLNLEKATSELATQSREKTPWATLISGAGLILALAATFSQMSISPVLTQLNRDKDDIKTIQTSIVPRGEHEERWRAIDVAISGLQRQVDQVRSDFGGTYSLKDAMSDFKSRIERIETEDRIKRQ